MNRLLPSMVKKRPEVIFWLLCAFILASIALIPLIDVYNIFDIRDRWYSDRAMSFYWFYWFLTPVEDPLQWLTLAAAIYVFFANWRLTHQLEALRPSRFWRLLGVGVILMLLEDIYDMRHHSRDFLTEALDSESYGYFGTFFELGYFAVLGAIMVFAVARYRKEFWDYTKARNYLIAGYSFYGLAAFSSWAGSSFQSVLDGDDLYTAIGRRVTGFLFGRDPESQALFDETNEPLIENARNTLEFFFMDSVYEESVELLGAAALLVAGLAFYCECRRRYTDEVGTADDDAPG